MPRDEMLKKLAELGVDCSVITDAVPDEVLAEWLRSADDRADQNDEEDEDATEDMDDDMDDMPDDMDDSNDEAAPDDEVDDVQGPPKKMGEKCATKYSERQKLSRLRKMLAVETKRALKAAKSARHERAETERFAEERRSAQKREVIETVKTASIAAGTTIPAEWDTGDPSNRFDELMRADNRRVVSKFSENGKQIELTDFQLKIRQIEKGQPRQYGEKFKDPAEAVSKEDAETRKVERHYEQYAEVFKKQGTSKAILVDGFKAARKHDSELRAEEFLGTK